MDITFATFGVICVKGGVYVDEDGRFRQMQSDVEIYPNKDVAQKYEDSKKDAPPKIEDRRNKTYHVRNQDATNNEESGRESETTR